MFRFHTGAPGGGKSSSVFEDVIEAEIVKGKRFVATNLAINMSDFADYLREEYGETFGLFQRMRILTASECLDFYNHPKPHCDIVDRIDVAVGEVWSAKRGGKVEVKENRPDFSLRGAYLDKDFKNPDYLGTVFVIDEGQEFFNARNWQTTSEDTLYYNTQHRKYQDDVHIITPSINFIDKQFRDVAQDFTTYRNLSYEWAGVFALPKRILMSIFLSPPSNVSKAMSTRTRKLNLKLARCYDTSAGVGAKGASADIGLNPKRGLPFWTLPVTVFLVLGLIAWVLVYVVEFSKKKAPASLLKKTGSQVVKSQSEFVANASLPLKKVPEIPALEENRSEDQYYNGYSFSEGVLRVYLESGEVVSSLSGRVGAANSRFCILDGKKVFARSRFDANQPNNNYANQPNNNYANPPNNNYANRPKNSFGKDEKLF